METGGRSPRNSSPRARVAAVLVTAACSTALFGLAGRDSGYLAIDSGPYLSVASHIADNGSPVSSFNFLGNFDRLPGPPNFIPPGTSVALALGSVVTGDPLTGAKLLLLCCMAVTQMCAIAIVKRLTGSWGYAVGASVVLVSTPRLASFSGLVLSELPFIASVSVAILAGMIVLEDESRPWVKWAGLPVAAAAVCSIRYLGAFFPLAFAAVYLASAGRPGARNATRAWGYAVYVCVLSLAPVAVWLWVAGSAAPSAMPSRPPAVLAPMTAILETLGALGIWLGPWMGLVVVTEVSARIRRAPPEATARRGARRGAFPFACAVAYLALLIVARTGQALHPLDRLGSRYLAPAWLPVFLAGAAWVHRFVGSRRDTFSRVALVAVAVVVAGWGATAMLAFRVPPPFPTSTETYRRAVDLVFEDDTVLCNYGQLLAVDRPDLRIIGIPSREDFVYEVDLRDTVRRFDVGWLVLFDVGGKESMYPAAVLDAFTRLPGDVAVRRGWRFPDGVIYQLGSEPGTTPRPDQKSSE